MDDVLSAKAMRLHRYHCNGCAECRFRDALPGSIGPADMELLDDTREDLGYREDEDRE